MMLPRGSAAAGAVAAAGGATSTPGRVMGLLGSAVKASLGYLRPQTCALAEAVVGLAFTAEHTLLLLTPRALECWSLAYTGGERVHQVRGSAGSGVQDNKKAPPPGAGAVRECISE